MQLMYRRVLSILDYSGIQKYLCFYVGLNPYI